MKKILIVEDDRVSRATYRRKIESFTNQTWDVVECATGEDGLKLCSEHYFDCILLDYLLPDLDGIAFLERLSEQSKRVIPVIMLTGEREEGLGTKALRMGAQDFLIKGTFNKELLCQCILNAIEKSQLVYELEERRRLYDELLVEVEASGYRDQRLKTLFSIDSHAEQKRQKPSSSTFNILIIDDDEDDLFILSELLSESKRSLKIVTCNELQAGIKAVQSRTWDCVLVDYMLGKGTAADVLKLWDVLPPMPIIVISGAADFNLATRLFRDGATDFLIKEEMTCDNLWERIDEAIKRHHRLRQGQQLNMLKQAHTQKLRHEARSTVSKEGKSVSMYRALMDHTEDFIFIIDAESARVEEENANVRRLLGYGLSSEHPYYFYWLCSTVVSLKKWRELLEDHKTEQAFQYETELKSRMGHRTIARVKVKFFEQDGRKKIMIVAQDISKQKRVEDELRQLARTDALTQIPNRRYLDEKIEEIWRLLVREKRPLAVIMLDVDYFKRYNDSAGHLMGDQCLKSISMCLRQVVNRPQDFVARYGGEEFAVLLPFTNLEGAQIIGKRIQESILGLELVHPDSPMGKIVTISQGIAAGFPTSEMNPAQFFEAADEALYLAKENGRNRIECQSFNSES